MKMSKRGLRMTALICTFLLPYTALAKGYAPSMITKPTSTPMNTDNSAVSQADQQKLIEVFVKNAADYIKKNGKEKAITEFNKKQGIFTRGDTFIFLMDYTGMEWADPYSPELNNRNQYDLKDADGKYVHRDAIAIAKSGGGWMENRWKEPSTQLITCKKSYIMPIEGKYLIGSGFFYAPNAQGKCSP